MKPHDKWGSQEIAQHIRTPEAAHHMECDRFPRLDLDHGTLARCQRRLSPGWWVIPGAFVGLLVWLMLIVAAVVWGLS